MQINISNDVKPIKIKKSPKINLSSLKVSGGERRQTENSERDDASGLLSPGESTIKTSVYDPK